jgi:hypothetical protein
MCLGALSRHVDELRCPEWDGRLVIAGEATIVEYEGSVHAALFSGKNAAESVHSHAVAFQEVLARKTEAADPKSPGTNKENTLLLGAINAL